MFDANEWKVANDLTVEDLITYMKNHFNPKAKVNIDGVRIPTNLYTGFLNSSASSNTDMLSFMISTAFVFCSSSAMLTPNNNISISYFLSLS